MSGARDPEAVYLSLMAAASPSFDAFDAHVTASILAISTAEAGFGGPAVAEAVGLDGGALAGLMAQAFAPIPDWLELPGPNTRIARSADEECLLDLLTQGTTSRSAFSGWLAAMVARRAQRPNHLWQDLGLRDRGELGRLMTRHFRPLAARNSQDMKWKKFLYRMICADASYTLCTAPSCGECDDFDQCFGEETGLSLLARAGR